MTAPSNSFLHATAIALAIDADGPLAGILIMGPSGSGKSSLALSATEGCPFRRTALVADDSVIVEPHAGGAVASAPVLLNGLIEVRGHGPAPIRSRPAIPLLLAIDLDGTHERVGEPCALALADGLSLPMVPFLWAGAEATGAHRLRVIVRQVLCGQNAPNSQDSGKN
ncbi:MAG: HPr kinase/phosphorylase [Parvularculaceae bacterium]